MPPTIGRIVHYRLSAEDVETIETMLDAEGWRAGPLTEGETVCATIVRTFDRPDQLCNLRLHIDGQGPDPWVTLRPCGTEPGQWWSWPERG